MRKEQKVELAEKLKERLKEAKIMIAVSYTGLSVHQMEDVRNTVKEQGDMFNVIKNNIVKKAIAGSGWETITEKLKGPNAFALGFSDPAALAKTLVDKSKDIKKLEVKFGCLGGKLLSKDDVIALSKLPPREIVLAQLLGTMKAPISGFVNVLAANIRQLLYVLNAIKEKKSKEV